MTATAPPAATVSSRCHSSSRPPSSFGPRVQMIGTPDSAMATSLWSFRTRAITLYLGAGVKREPPGFSLDGPGSANSSCDRIG